MLNIYLHRGKRERGEKKLFADMHKKKKKIHYGGGGIEESDV